MTEKQKILLVDDDPEFRRAMKKLFEKSGYDVTAAGDGEEALEALGKSRFDLIISDLRMPRLDGIELMEEIKRKKVNVPVIFITGYGEVESYMDAMNLGAFEYINKPVKGQEILSVARKALETCGGSRRISGA
ncbi:MAG: response regulator [Candidatus Abyssobacteria bacterium SURF_17]|uniref:Response regulator n=1 Tax=Candidatus Abyssobacteria bacterium SURF_17 TaxID=2093361 RepID=A0A419ESW4_9BACT|nr:MAG: response regulator [Candidatus Abyssubacteria bacterium SURF_17]